MIQNTDLVDIALTIIQNTGKSVLIFEGSMFSVTQKSLYNPSDHVYFNRFTGKFIEKRFVEGNNFKEINYILENTPERTIHISHTEKFLLIST